MRRIIGHEQLRPCRGAGAQLRVRGVLEQAMSNIEWGGHQQYEQVVVRATESRRARGGVTQHSVRSNTGLEQHRRGAALSERVGEGPSVLVKKSVYRVLGKEDRL